MRTFIVFLLLILCVVLMVGIYIQQPQLFGDSTTVISTPVLSTTATSVNIAGAEGQGEQSTQTAVANQTNVTAFPLVATPVIQVHATIQPTIAKPARLPDTGSADSSDIWSNIPLISLIGFCVILGFGLYWQNTRVLK